MTEAFDPADRLAAVEADNARLRRLLDEAGLHDGLRHFLRDSVALLRVVIRRTSESAVDAASFAAHLEGRLDTLARIRDRTDTFGEAPLHSLVSDELMVHLAREGERAMLAGPRVHLRPKAAQVLALAMHELASNAVEHGALGRDLGRVGVTWRVGSHEAEPILVLTWKETGGRSAEPSRRGFGTEVLKDMLAYDLRARVDLAYEADGLRCVIRIPLISRVGRLVEDDVTDDSEDGAEASGQRPIDE